MPPKGKKSKAEEALAFLDDLDNLEAPPVGPDSTASAQQSTRQSTDSARKSESVEAEPPADKEAEDALAFLESQIKQKRAPLSVGSGTAASASRTSSPQLSGPSASPAASKSAPEPTASAPSPAPAPSGSFWGMSSSLWSSASSALQSAQRVAEEQYSKVKTEGVSGLRDQLDHLQVGGVDLAKLRKDAEERIGAAVKGVGNVDFEKLRSDLLNQAGSTFATIINTVAPPISAHETIELWFSHTMVGYDGVEGVVYRAWTAILEQTESGELLIMWSPPDSSLPEERTLNPVDGWDAGWKSAQSEIEALRKREEKNPRHKQAQRSEGRFLRLVGSVRTATDSQMTLSRPFRFSCSCSQCWRRCPSLNLPSISRRPHLLPSRQSSSISSSLFRTLSTTSNSHLCLSPPLLTGSKSPMSEVIGLRSASWTSFARVLKFWLRTMFPLVWVSSRRQLFRRRLRKLRVVREPSDVNAVFSVILTKISS